MRPLDHIIKKHNLETVTSQDLTDIGEYLKSITPYPWSVTHVTRLTKPIDVEFVRKSPEMVEFLINLCHWLYERVNPSLRE